LKAFSKDYHVVAVDMRGYGDTDQPVGSSEYSFNHLTEDIVKLIPALGHSSCVLVGHDWGGVVSWRVTQRYPELVDRHIVLNCPHGRVFKKFLENSWTQLRRSWVSLLFTLNYSPAPLFLSLPFLQFIFLFQIPRLPEALIRLQDYQFLEQLFTSHTSGVKNRDQFPSEVVEAYKYTFSRPGTLTGPINYYRAMFSSPKDSLPREKWTISVPTLIIWGDDDHVLQREMADCHDTICSDLTVKHIPNCSHWVQQDVPDLCNQYMTDFLTGCN
jgi:pimeloyl-ACP methyl ester carboxylesterase